MRQADHWFSLTWSMNGLSLCWHQCLHGQAAWAVSDSTIGGSTCLLLLFTTLTAGFLRTHCLNLTAVCSPAPFRALLCLSYLQASRTCTAHVSVRQSGAAGADGAPQDAKSDGRLSRWMTLKTSETCCDINNTEISCFFLFCFKDTVVVFRLMKSTFNPIFWDTLN